VASGSCSSNPVPSKKQLALDPAAWVQAQRNTIGRPCSICASRALAEWVRLAVLNWASPKTPLNQMSWPKLAAGLRLAYGTKTVWESARRHVKEHEPRLWAKLERRLGE